MKVDFLTKFTKDVDKLEGSHMESADSLSEIPKLKKLKGHKSVFRLKIGDYRIGIFVEGKTVEMARVIHRKDIYNVFP